VALALLAAVATGARTGDGHPPPADPGLGWTIVGFTGDGLHVVFEREQPRPGCLEISLEIFRVEDNQHVVSIPLQREGEERPRCVDRGDSEVFAQAVTRVGEVFGWVTVPRRLVHEDGEWREGDTVVSLEAQVQYPAEGCSALTPELRARAYLRFHVARGERSDVLGRLVEIEPAPDPQLPGCLAWPRVVVSSAALRGDGARLAAVVAGLPLVLALP